MSRAIVIALDADTSSMRAIVHVQAGDFDDLAYEFVRKERGGVWLFQACHGSRIVPYRDGVAAARRAALEAMDAQLAILDAKYPRTAELRKQRDSLRRGR